MRRTFHIDSSANETSKLNIAECHNNTHVVLSINNNDQTAEIVLDLNAFEELCGLKYSLDLVESEQNPVAAKPTESIETNETILREAA